MMALTRRGFVQTVGIGAAGALTSSWIGSRGRENDIWSLVEPSLHAVEPGLIVLASNEKPIGPGAKVLEAVKAAGFEGVQAGHKAQACRDVGLRVTGGGRINTPAGTGVLIKAAKLGQDQRIDLPVIGPPTVEAVSAAGLAGIAVVAGSTIVAEPERIAAAADGAKIFVVGVGADEAAR